METTKQCAQCKEIKELDAFHLAPKGPLGRCSYCRDCCKLNRKKPSKGKAEVTCTWCGEVFYKSRTLVRERNFCNVEHKGLWQKGKFLGEDNPNYGNAWDDDLRNVAAERQRQRMQVPELRKAAGAASHERAERRVQDPDIEEKNKIRRRWHRKKSPKPKKPRKGKPHSPESLLKIAAASKAKFEKPGFRERQRQVMEERGYWLPKDQHSDYKIYFQEANWICGMWNLVDNQEELALLKDLGVFNQYSNTNGVVRDHMFSRKTGFNLGVYPEILRHPANMQIITHSANASKRRGQYIDGDSLTLEALFVKIRTSNVEWEEHAEVLRKIIAYEQGGRWVNRYQNG